MIRDEVLIMPAGREMDAFIAEYVMGIEILRTPKSAICNGCRVNMGTWAVVEKNYHEWGDKVEDVHLYSTDISAAWEVVEKSVDFELSRTIWSPHGWECGIRLNEEDSTIWGKGATAPLAICRAALLAV